MSLPEEQPSFCNFDLLESFEVSTQWLLERSTFDLEGQFFSWLNDFSEPQTLNR